MYKKVAFTGHRVLTGYDFDYALLDRVILNLLKEGADEFYCGMALGFDMAAAESLLQYRNDFGFKLVACLPYPGQNETFSEKNKERHQNILERCDEVISVSEYYYNGCMFARDRYLVDNCDVLVSFLRRKSGGTFYTVNYAKQKGVNVIEL